MRYLQGHRMLRGRLGAKRRANEGLLLSQGSYKDHCDHLG